jgi:hypothetical protein
MEPAKRSWQPPDTISSKEANILDQTRKGKDRVEWLNPIAMSMLQKAVKARKKTVHLNGLEFAITYGIRSNSSLVENYEQIKLKRTDGVPAPMAYLKLEKVLDFDFEATE